MKRCEREAVDIIRSLLEPHGITCRAESGGKHLAVHVDHNGGHHKFPISSSPLNRDHQLTNVRQQVTGWMETQGLVPPRGQVATRPQKRRRKARVRSLIQRYEVSLDEPDHGPSSDPWRALRALQEREA
jgi:hypothetical protein